VKTRSLIQALFSFGDCSVVPGEADLSAGLRIDGPGIRAVRFGAQVPEHMMAQSSLALSP
jgi:hypothetical protein